jgi:hypothetical protein
MGVADVMLGQVRSVSSVRRIAAMDPVLCDPCVTKSRVGTHCSGAQNPRDTLFKGRNIQELSVGDTSVGDTSTLHHFMNYKSKKYVKKILTVIKLFYKAD